MTNTAPQTDLPLGEVIDSMNGHDELAVDKFFTGFNVFDTAQASNAGQAKASDAIKLLRVGVFVVKRHGGMVNDLAYAEALDMTAKQLDGYFAEEPDDLDADDPDTAAGKGSSAPE